MSALAEELLEALASPRGRQILQEIIGEVVRHERECVEDERLVDIDIAAQLTGRSAQAIYRAASRGTMPGVVRQGGRLLFRRGDLMRRAASGGGR